MKGIVFNTLFDFVYDFGGESSVKAILQSACLPETTVYRSDQEYDDGQWRSLFNATCLHLNISTKRLEQVVSMFFSEDGSENFEEREGQIKKSKSYKGENRCPLPFTQLFLNNKGKINPCGSLRNVELGDIRENTLEEIWNGDKIKDIRKTIMDGSFTYCEKYMNNFGCQFTHDIMEYSHSFDYAVETTSPMRRMDLDLNGQCNLACVMCTNYLGPNGSYTDENFWQEAEEKIFPHLEEVALKGGEPMIQSDTYKLADVLSRANPKCRWNITTNGHYKLGKAMKKMLDKVDLESVGVSLDSLDPEIYPTIRVNGNLEIPLRTIEDLIVYNEERGMEKKFLILVNYLISKKTWHEYPTFMEYCRRRKIKLNAEILIEPESESIYDLSDEERLEIVKFYLKSNERYLNTAFFNNITRITKSLPKIMRLEVINDIQTQGKKISSRIIQESDRERFNEYLQHTQNFYLGNFQAAYGK